MEAFLSSAQDGVAQIPKRGIEREKLISRFDKFAVGQWHDLIVESNKCAEEAATAYRRRARRGHLNQDDKRAARAFNLVQMGELSAGRQALEGAELAPENEETLNELRKREPRPREVNPPLPPSAARCTCVQSGQRESSIAPFVRRSRGTVRDDD